MASLYITEFQASGNAESGAQLQVGVQPAVAMQKLTFTTSTQSAEFDDRTRFIRLHTDAAGTAPYSGGALRRIDALF